ncbi:hypothetical protein SAMN02745181_0721 [Rubritalea squalenifaciens DSM 18772]|uniref:Uncharacterized protein n=2 Tax=Rubritalea TaxID=361050 RepID=A0A1M6DFH3_9BACT|nr:hypothetical protein [Rubritalea squalenifaciens]SHI71718.1 hypothetical protein SAMN02745181_0721 [Rubritalea squalenifaciens DSM 18772]
MKALRIITIAAAAAGSLILSSCGCCTGEAKAPELRPLPTFNEIPVTPTK